MGSTKNLRLFIIDNFGQEAWDEMCDIIESTSVLAAKNMVGTQYIEDVVMNKITKLIAPLPDDQIMQLEYLLGIDNDLKGVLFDSIQRLKKERRA